MDDGDFSWNQIPDSTWNLAVTYSHPLESTGGRLTWRVGYQYTDEVNGGGTSPDTNTIAMYQERKMWDANLNYVPAEGNWSVTLFGKNLSDEEYYQFKTPFSTGFGIAQPMVDATWGATLSVSL